MPELPEVETVVRGLQEKVTGLEVSALNCFRDGTVLDYRENRELPGRIEAVRRRGKYILLDTNNHTTILIHLRMTGKLVFEKETKNRSNHCRAEIRFKTGSKLVFDDVRTFGKIKLYKSGGELKELTKLGPEPLTEEFGAEYLLKKLKDRKAPIKNILLDQRVIAGLGNIYVAEILHRAGISPRRAGRELKRSEVKRIVTHTKDVLSKAIECNGTTISDYRSVEDKTGEFQNFLRVYGKKKCNCGAEIKKIKQAGRSTYYCPVCQK